MPFRCTAAEVPPAQARERAELGWEDEKFSYAVRSREPVTRPESRIIRPPMVRGGHVNLVTSDKDGVVRSRTVAKREGDGNRRARKAD